ncbi:hypothetical protein [Kitasatospora sp. NRRL B-11411]|uniref:hypothetical protein n=1 Tax=Kitasatospora sp. NRRL B-11411 TaxID=1463822 RepID=UPI000B080632|nr:hypothetical protein [Kitasatospora sp. NRRL B-11411]
MQDVADEPAGVLLSFAADVRLLPPDRFEPLLRDVEGLPVTAALDGTAPHRRVPGRLHRRVPGRCRALIPPGRGGRSVSCVADHRTPFGERSGSSP